MIDDSIPSLCRRPYCSGCGKWMNCLENDVEVKRDESCAQRGDRYGCGDCGIHIVCNWGKPYWIGEAALWAAVYGIEAGMSPS